MAKTQAKICFTGNGIGATATMLYIGLWLLVFALQQQTSECRYLPTRSHGDDLDKLRELMLQILESSNEEQRPPPNEANGNPMSHRAAWLNKLGSSADSLEPSRKYGTRGGLYDNGRYY